VKSKKTAGPAKARAKAKKAKTKPRCKLCRRLADAFTENPYQAELYGDHKRAWYCNACLQESANEV